jgi:hypothetical protein
MVRIDVDNMLPTSIGSRQGSLYVPKRLSNFCPQAIGEFATRHPNRLGLMSPLDRQFLPLASNAIHSAGVPHNQG